METDCEASVSVREVGRDVFVYAYSDGIADLFPQQKLYEIFRRSSPPGPMIDEIQALKQAFESDTRKVYDENYGWMSFIATEEEWPVWDDLSGLVLDIPAI